MQAIPFRQVDVFTRVPFQGNPAAKVQRGRLQAARLGGRYIARQGMQLGRDGRVSVRIEGGKIFLGGSAVTCIEGSLRPPAG